ncbi:protein SET DOMAIN GROUP 41 isoform X2 [Ananas comosus]|uniref:Protein SET DOMAIN GROUP 41 isoform X2 n=1 Tax=Ananas comosus TaxID=4615 RepID=A0A6P5GU77_ANACO|nr:protein SET DOMAIN GROUP 41 isoform X2 [Ananas comosus]
MNELLRKRFSASSRRGLYPSARVPPLPGMEMRAREDTCMSHDLTPPIPPYAVSLHDRFLCSHCSSCFRALPSHAPQQCFDLKSRSNSAPPFSCPTCFASVRYCSSACFASDRPLHVSSHECFLLHQSHSGTCPADDDTADLRVALRLLYSLEMRGLLPSESTDLPNRIGGLLVSDLQKVLEEGGEVAEKIREGGMRMSCARNSGGLHGAVMVEEVVLWAVITNAVEVQVSKGPALGVAVYGPWFSWFNHSCSPNACYRFELDNWCEESTSCESSSFRVSPASTDEASIAGWYHEEGGLARALEFCKYGPRIVVRSIKPINKGEEVCVTYTDLLQPMAIRRVDLWPKYRFSCCCERCSASPQLYVDYILSCDARNLNTKNNNSATAEYDELADLLHEAIAEYSSEDNPKSCCYKLESLLLSQSSRGNNSMENTLSGRKFLLHPLHHLSLSAYVALASAYRSLYIIGLYEEQNGEALKMGRAAAAYSLLLAAATHYLSLFESSLIAPTSHFWLSAGETILNLVQSSISGKAKEKYESKFRSVSHFQCAKIERLSRDEFMSNSMQFIECISTILSRCWPFLVRSFSYLEKIEDPINFTWLGGAILRPLCSLGSKGTTAFGKSKCFAWEYQSGRRIEEEMNCLYQLAIYSLRYGRYLATICYGPQSYLIDKLTI